MCLIGDIWGENQAGCLRRRNDFIFNYTAHFSKIDTNGSSSQEEMLLISSALFVSRACILGWREFDLYHDSVHRKRWRNMRQRKHPVGGEQSSSVPSVVLA